MHIVPAARRRGGLFVLALLAMAGPLARSAEAQHLTIGMASSIVALFPHFYNASADKTLAIHIFDWLVDFDRNVKLIPGLATQWHDISPTEWEFTLRPGVVWQDGTPFTADDVAFTIGRVPHIPNSPGGFDGFVQAITKVEVVNPLLIRFHTASPYANLPLDLASIAIVSRHAGQGATTEDYNSLKAAIGTGPYRVVKYVAGDRVELERNDKWWGPKPEWSHVTVRTITAAAPRTAALMSGDVDLIDSVSTSDLPLLRKDRRFTVYSSPSLRTFDLRLNYTPANPPYIADNDGKPMAQNPLRDLRVRQAMNLAINRQAISDRIMEGACTPTVQWLPEGSYSYDPALKPVYDPEKAKSLLAAAGLPEGFHLVLHAPSDRYPNGTAVAQAIAQNWSRVGIQTQVEALPWSAFSNRLAHREFAISMGGLGVASGEARYVLLNFFGTSNAALGRGASNHSGYTNPALDRLIDEEGATFDDTAREQLLVKGEEMVAHDVAGMTICQIEAFWATRKNLTYVARVDERTLAMGVHSAKP